MTVPTVCVSNAVDTLRDFAVRADGVDELLSECWAQQDQALFWGPLPKMIITYEPIADLDWQRKFLELDDVVNLSPAGKTGSLFADALADPELMTAVAAYAGPGRRIRLIPHTTTADLWHFAEALRTGHGIAVELPESTPRQDLRDAFDTKTGLRDLAADLGMTDGPCRIPPGIHCAGREEIPAAVRDMLATGRPCIVKADRGEASIGLLIFRPGDDDIDQRLAASPFYGEDQVVVEEFVEGDIAFPSVEYMVPEHGTPHLCYTTDMLFEGATHLRGNVTARELRDEWWYKPLTEGGQRLAEEMQRRGYRGHFGIDAIARDGEVHMHDLNARRTGSTHVHEFGDQFIGPGYIGTHAVGNYDFYGLPSGLELGEVLRLLGQLVASPRHADRGVVPTELTDLHTGRLSCMFFAPSLTELHDLIAEARVALGLDL
ncbi:ATP-grasp domain-containing protein [Streptomyces blastmyceticus]|uniref:ATP-grasp domain-containing protein n=1 Tax=Streptomyces blastmyceticus TaxID=68180 RepID=A0ABN0XM23_9ACTN